MTTQTSAAADEERRYWHRKWDPDIECEHRFEGGNRCGAKPEHAVHIYNKWPGPEPYHLFVAALSADATGAEGGDDAD